MNSIEKYVYDGIGYNPVLIRRGWQVAILNCLPGHGLNEIDRLEVHNRTDEVFILLKGTAVLIAGKPGDKTLEYEPVKMEQGQIYNIPKGCWHNIAMDEEARLIIVENDHTHRNDVSYLPLNAAQQRELRALINGIVKQ
ncbi:MAG: cupin domain-containing protein [Tannerella sp.]|jgi:mannose-6-phosphate isomerase-like protein (cupin superfamily)|nr:cupin domain-containing protein [Tannerella sp.]